MKQFVFVLILLLGKPAFSQQIDSLHVMYYVGCDCSYVIDSVELRGGCEKTEKIDYHKQKQVYRIGSFISKSKFRQREGKFVSDSIIDSITKKFSHHNSWKGGFGANLIVDSIKNLSSFRNGKMATKKLDDFLRRICSIQTDTVFPYSIKDIPERFLTSNSLTRESCEMSYVDSLLQEEFYSISMSGAIARLNIFFKMEGLSCCLIKSSDYDWTLLTSDSDKPKKFVYFAFDAFLLNELPKNFSGIKVLD
jgi:hypothetical protein